MQHYAKQCKRKVKSMQGRKKPKPLSRAQTKSDLCKLENIALHFLSYGDIALMNFPILEKPALHFSILGWNSFLHFSIFYKATLHFSILDWDNSPAFFYLSKSARQIFYLLTMGKEEGGNDFGGSEINGNPGFW